MKSYILKHRQEVSWSAIQTIIQELEWTAQSIRLSKGRPVYRRANVRGVPAKRLDVLVEETILSGSEDDFRESGSIFVIDVGIKRGRYDGAERPRLCLRTFGKILLEKNDIPFRRATIDSCEGKVAIRIGDWEFSDFRLASIAQITDLRGIYMWHWSHYYQTCMDWEEAEQCADSFYIDGQPTLAELNRAVSRDLYKRARENGWMKLTVRQRELIGSPDGPQWVRESLFLKKKAEQHRISGPSGVSQYTMDESMNGPFNRIRLADAE
jgi:hypothetical protein